MRAADDRRGWHGVGRWFGAAMVERWPPRGMAAVAFWLLVALVGLSVLRFLPGIVGTWCAVLQVLVGLVLLPVGVPVLWQMVRQRLLWSLRNRLVLLYLLVGLAPVVLLVTLVGISAYIAAGQFAIHLAEIRLLGELEQLGGLNALALATLQQQPAEHAGGEETFRWSLPFDPQAGVLRHRLDAYVGSVTVPVTGESVGGRSQLGLPPWAMRLPHGQMQAIVLEDGALFLVAVRQKTLPDGRRLSLVSSSPVDAHTMEYIAENLGRAGMMGFRAEEPVRSPGSTRAKGGGRRAAGADPDPGAAQMRRSGVYGGTEPMQAGLLDFRVRFLSTLPIVEWDTGRTSDVPIEVDSRPSRLYQHLFGSALAGIVTRVLRISLLVLCLVFALLEAVALWMAARLTRTVTTSVTELYDATQRVDRGDLQHTIAVTRDDQMAALERSFNVMMGSLQRLLVEQKEKNRMQNELAIAQEVQANLFPREEFALPQLELHGVCRPARTVSGDYYDFLLLGQEGADGSASGLGIAVGDISGKGISAALLMATLHSAVRAYRLASEDLIQAAAKRGRLEGGTEAAAVASLFESPGNILGLLNRHLYRTTTPEKYATLFLAHYDARSARLTYSNGGQLPPLILRRDGSVCRLECGGTVVGLMDGMVYQQETVVMEPGDILVAYSDGVTEPENDFGDFGEDRLMEVVRRFRAQPLPVITTEILSALDAWIGAEEQPDDITLVLARQA